MSCQRGNAKKVGPPKHPNRSAFKNNLHDTSRTTKVLNSLVIGGVCRRCKEILDWKIKFKKYKIQGQPSKCIKCSQKAVKRSYCIVCDNCATSQNMCQKCAKPLDDTETGDGDAKPSQSESVAEVARKLGDVEIAIDEVSAASQANREEQCSKCSSNGNNENVSADEVGEAGSERCDDSDDEYDQCDDSLDEVENDNA